MDRRRRLRPRRHAARPSRRRDRRASSRSACSSGSSVRSVRSPPTCDTRYARTMRLWLLAGSIVVACGGAPAPPPTLGGALVVDPASKPAPAPAPAPPQRPTDVAAWIHVDDPDGVLDV